MQYCRPSYPFEHLYGSSNHYFNQWGDHASDSDSTNESIILSNENIQSSIDLLKNKKEEPLLIPMEEYLASSDYQSDSSQEPEETVEELDFPLFVPITAESDNNDASNDFEAYCEWTRNELTVRLRCPRNVKKDALHLEIKDSRLEILEEVTGFKYTLTLPDTVNPEKAHASFQDSILTISIRKKSVFINIL